MKHLFIIFILMIFSAFSYAQDDEVWFHPNRGQWDNRIEYKVGLLKGNFFIEKDKFTFALNDLGEVYHEAHEAHEVNGEMDIIQNQTIHTHFLNSSWGGVAIESDSSTFYQNYMLGNDRSQWHSRVYSYKKLELIDYYPNIDLILETSSEHIKYSFRVHPGANPSQIQLFYEGMDGLIVAEKQVEIQTRFGSIYDKNLHSWVEKGNGKKVEIPSEFKVNGNTVSFYFPEGYDATSTLIIDPSLTFSSFTGATSDNWGFTAAPDADGNLFAGGIVFGIGYPTTTGAYDVSYNGGEGTYKIDMGITKFSSNGTQLMYSTFIGGNRNETPNSIISNDNGDLYILGITTSPNFPTSANAFQSTYHGGTSTNQIAIQFTGSDIVVCKLSNDGTNLQYSTYIGGSMNDGLNISSLNYNYGDVFRGEIILDNNGNVVFTSSTQSADFPIVNGNISTIQGGQDAVVVKMTPDLSSIIWSTFLGGSGDDSGFSIQVSSDNNLYVTGGTKSSGLPFSSGFQTSYQGGNGDGYIVRLNGNTSAVLSGTYIGTSGYDQSFFVQLDTDDNVYVFGQTSGNMPITPGKYSNPSSGQFIQKYSTNLGSQLWTTRVGGGNGVVEISPTAFLVSNCKQIYFTGWGGQVNQSVQAVSSTSFGFPTTPDAYQSNTNGNNFYIGVLNEDAVSLNYGTFMGGVNSSYNHVDGGTCRFDKHGSIYHAVCGACGGSPNGFTTTPGAWSTTNNSSNCNMAAWKFDLYKINAAFSLPSTTICMPSTANFSNNSQNGNTYFWDFGDGNTSTSFQPTHVYETPGIYEVMLVVGDNTGCFQADTSYLEVELIEFVGGTVLPPSIICPGESIQLNASGGSQYSWSPAEFLDNASLANPIATLYETTSFTVVVSDACGTDDVTITVPVAVLDWDVSEDLEICKGETVTISASGGATYVWTSTQPASFVGLSNQATVTVSPQVTATYPVLITTIENCEIRDTVKIKVYQDIPYSNLIDTAHICKDDIVPVSVQSDALTFLWSPDLDINSTTIPSVIISTPENRWYYVDLWNPCGTHRDSVFIELVNTYPRAGNDTIVCPGEPVHLWADGGLEYHWSPPYAVYNPTSNITMANPNSPTEFTVLIIDQYGCNDSAKVVVDHYPDPWVIASPDYYGFIGDIVTISANGNGNNGVYEWDPPSFLSCTHCQSPTSTSPKSITYFVNYTDENGCITSDDVSLHFEVLLYVPNTFTPDGNEFNNEFLAVISNIVDFEMLIFNRWGELIFESHDPEHGWDGTYGGKLCQDGTYIWKIKYEDTEGIIGERVGHVNLLK